MKIKPLTWCIFILLLSMSPVNAAEDPEQPEKIAAAEVNEPPAPPKEFYLAIFGGNADVSDSNVTATYQCFFCTPVTASRNVQFENGTAGGVRLGVWGSGRYEYTGISVEASRTKVHSREVEVNYDSFSIMPALRYPLFKTSSMPNGHVNLYMGLALSRLATGEVSVNFPELPNRVKISENMSGNGTGTYAGISARYYNLAAFIEWRKMDMSVSGDYLGDRVDLSVSTSQKVLGIAFYFQ